MKPIMITARLFLLTGIVATVLYACTSEAGEGAPAAPQGPQKLPVDAIVVQEADFKQDEQLVGTLAPYREITIVSEMPRKVVSIHFKDGAHVHQGQLLYKLDDADLRAQLKRTEAEVALATINEQRLAALMKTESAMQQQYDEASTRLSALTAEKELLQVQLSKTEIRAPFPGIIGISKVHEGALVSPHTPLVNLQDNSKIKLYFSVPENHQHLIENSSKITFAMQAGDQQHTAVIMATEPGADVQNRSILVQAVADNPQGFFRAGASAIVYFSTTKRGARAITIPTVALIPGAQGYAVFKIENGNARLQPVQVASRNETAAVITSGLTSGDTLMISNILRATEGTPVQVVAASLTPNP